LRSLYLTVIVIAMAAWLWALTASIGWMIGV
jgi:hypothetical protein